ncbi:tetratricopeptide repeat protein [Flavobacterium sp.]
MNGKFDLALQNYKQAEKMYVFLEDEKNIFKVKSELSAVYYSVSDYNKALEISSELIPELRAFGDEKLLNIQLLRQANILFNLADYDCAIDNYKKTLTYFNKDIGNNIQNKYVALMNIGECYSQLNNKKSLDYFNQSLKGFQSISDQRNENLCLSRIGKYYFKDQKYNDALPFLKKSFDYFYASLPHLSIEIYAIYIRNLLKINQYAEIQQLLTLDTENMLSEANLQEKVFYYETMALVYEKLNNVAKEYDALKNLQKLYAEREKKNTFEELQKQLNQFNIKEEISKNKNLELKVFNLKLQNGIILISVLFTIVGVYYFVDKYKKKNKIQELSLKQLEQEKKLHEKSAKLSAIQLQFEAEIIKAKERELTALQLKIFQIKEKVIGFLETNELNIESKSASKLIKNIDRFFDNEDYWKEFQLKFINMHPNFISEINKRYPKLTKKDIDFLVLIKLNLSNKEIATLINISYESVISKRYLLRKKMGINSDSELVSVLS